MNDCSSLILTFKQKNQDYILPIAKRRKITCSNSVNEQKCHTTHWIDMGWKQLQLCIWIVDSDYCDMWIQQMMTWTDRLLDINADYSQILVDGFTQVKWDRLGLDNTRDKVRHLLHWQCDQLFPRGHNSASVYSAIGQGPAMFIDTTIGLGNGLKGQIILLGT